MPMAEEDLGFGNESWEQREQLFMMEVLVDRVKVKEDNAFAAPSPVLPTLVKIQFADFPVMSVERDDLLLAEKLDSDDSSTLTVHDKIIKGVPEEWIVKKAGNSHYSVDIPVIARPSMWGSEGPNHIKILVPRMVVAAGEGLKYIFAALKSRRENEVLFMVEHQVAQEQKRMQETGESRVVTQHKFSSGKSCLFHMTPSDLLASLQEYPLKIQVYRSCTEGKEFVHTLIGEANVPLGLSFTKAVLLANTPVLLPVAAHVENVFPMTDIFGRETGSICIFVRLSCFGASVFQEHEDAELKKQRFLKSILNKEQTKYSCGELDLQYPWKKNLNAVGDRPAPKPRLQPMYDPLPPPPPPPMPPFDMGEYLPNLPRCSPLTPPPCYRRAGDPPLSRCTREMETQLKREELTKGAQTETLLPNVPQPYYQYDYGSTTQGLAGGNPDAFAPPNNDSCTCPSIPPELLPHPGSSQKVECTCAALMKTLGPSQESQPQQVSRAHIVELPRVAEPPPLGDSDYEINLTKITCGLEEQKETIPPEVSKETETQPETAPSVKSRSNIPKLKNKSDEMPESVQNLLKTEVIKHNEVQNESPIQSTWEQKNEEEKQPAPIQPHNKQEEEDENDLDDYENGEMEQKKEKRPKKKAIYVQTAGMYPGRHVGHKHCLIPQRPVPKTMGWLWTAVTFNGLLKAGRGWRPGSIRNDVNSMLHTLHADDSDDESKTGKKTITRRFRPFSAKSQQSKKTVEKIKPNPTLHIHKKEGYIYVSMIPTKTDSQEEAGEEPKPIQFKIDPKHPDGREDGESCYGSSSSSSDVKSYEMDFTAPIALKKRKRKVDKNTTATQYNELDFTKKIILRTIVEPEPSPKAKEEKKGKVKKGGKGKKGKKK